MNNRKEKVTHKLPNGPSARGQGVALDEGDYADEQQNDPKAPMAERMVGGRGWYFPEVEGPDLSEELFAGEHEALEALDTQSVEEIFQEVLGSGEAQAGAEEAS